MPLTQYWALLGDYLWPQRRRVSLLAVLMLAHITLRLLNPQVIRLFIDAAVAGEELNRLLAIALAFLVVAVLDQGLAIANTTLGQDVAWWATNALRRDLILHCLELDSSFHKVHTPGELIERIDGDVNALSNFFSRLIVDVVGNGFLLIGILGLLFRQDLWVGLGLAVFALLSLIVLIRLRAIAVPHWVKVRQQSADFYGFLGERLAGSQEIRANGAQDDVMRRFYEIGRRWLPIQVKAGVARNTTWMAGIGMYALGNMTAFLLGAHLWRTGTITIGTVYLIFHYTELLLYPILQIRAQMADLQQAEASIVRVRALFDTSSRLQDGANSLVHGPLSVDVRGVSFGYDDEGQRGVETPASPLSRLGRDWVEPSADPPTTAHTERGAPPNDLVFHDLSFSLDPGRVLGLLGHTGSGKTTLARLLLRLVDPTAGEIRLGGVSTTAVRLRDVRDRVGMVTQDVQLFQATVRDNVTLFAPTISDERIVAVLNDLGLSAWLKALPGGLDTELRAGGGSLSAGQAQLLAFARVFLRDPGLVILDEASSRLDPASERLLERAIDKLLQGRTGIVIAHRLSTVHRADEIVILEHGRILEHGARTALAGDPDSHFYRLLQTGLEEVLV